ncbi:hypothetical protein SAMN04488514_103406 [Kriegella aquimaris]|uniref:Uncharacterized protein n=1 Tax=Kriegella aquimaris TaxID=192904 RepID=A0A1G9P224_9FLAO|nr:hypothetical protein SAMN04488514_103406 [Kriegella aquimaris]
MYLRTIVLMIMFPLYLISLETRYPYPLNSNLTQKQPKDDALIILQTKCNFCHTLKKRTDIFTLENMDSLAVEINKQVFIKRKMPKGRKVALTPNEERTLKNWIELTLKQ